MASSSVTYNSHAQRPDGYPSHAKFISTSPDGSVFRKFTELNVRNLLYLQSETLDLEAQLYKHDAEDVEVIAAKSDLDDAVARDHAARSYLQLKRGQRVMDQGRLELVQRIREALKAYNEALVLFGQVITMDTPSRRVMKCLNSVENPLIDFGERYLENEGDLAVLAGSITKSDTLTERIRSLFGYTLRAKTADGGQEIGYVSLKRVDRIVNIVKVLLATLFLGGAILVLYFVKSNKIRPAIITAFVSLFALCLTFSTAATKVEIYGASAA
ncbi:hypothetical protein BDD12DRAFT_873416 [Trichophaea hybrida]|nr:hypothetical protein BDD12DRAFT_873416 [Trichophaea hybrida]